MANNYFKETADFIRNEVPAVNVRTSIADGFEQVDNFMQDEKTIIRNDVNTQLDDFRDGTSAELQGLVVDATRQILNDVGEVNADAEVVAARIGVDGINSNLIGERIDSMQAQINTTTSLTTVFEMARKTKKTLDIACLGDSLTYGYDIVSTDRRPPDTNKTDNGTAHIRERASVTYPEFLQTCLREVYGADMVNVRNMGFSGDTTKTAYTHWNKSGADIILIMLGTNDSSNQTVKEFIKYYRLLIERELKNGTAVILLTPPKTKDSASIGIDVYAQAVKTLASENNLPLVDMIGVTANASSTIYSDGTHLNGAGYKFLGAVIASLFIGKGINNANEVYSGESLFVRSMIDSFQNFGGTRSNSENYPTVSEYVENQGTAFYLDNKNVYFSFYCAQDNMLVYPAFYSSVSTTEVKLTLDFGVNPQAITNNLRINQNSYKVSKQLPTTTTIKFVDANATSITGLFSHDRENLIDFNKGLFIAKKGWHTIKLESVGNVTFYSLDFISLSEMKLKIQTGVYSTKTHPDYNSTGVVLQTKIKVENLEQKLGHNFLKTSFWENPILKLVVNNWNGTSEVYAIQWNTRGVDSTFLFAKIDSIKFSTVTEARTLASVNYLVATDEIVLNWAGATSRATQISIEIL